MIRPPTADRRRASCGKPLGVAFRVIWVVIIIGVSVLLTLFSALWFGESDPISGVKYRGFPVAFWKFPPSWDPVQAWRFSPLGLVVDTVLWSLPAVGFVLVRHIWREERSRGWRLKGKCGECGYNLQGSPQARCSECGTVAENPQDVQRRGAEW